MLPDNHNVIHHGVRPAEDNFNINDWVKYFLIKALNNSETREEAAYKLGVTLRTLFRYMQFYNVKRETNRKGKYFFVEKKKFRLVGRYFVNQQ